MLKVLHALQASLKCLMSACTCAHSHNTKSCVQLFEAPTDYSPPGSSIHRILQARILERVAISYSSLMSKLTKFGMYHQQSHLTLWESINNYLFYYYYYLVLHVSR